MIKKLFSALAAIALLAVSACTEEEINKILNGNGDDNKDVAVSSIALDQVQVEMTVGETLNLFPTVLPDNATDKTPAWTSSAPRVASVEGAEIPDVTGIPIPVGKVTALSEGESIITATAGDKTASCKVIVKKKDDGGQGGEGGEGGQGGQGGQSGEGGGQSGDGKIEATQITLNKTEITLATGLSEQLEVIEILPANANEKTVVWESSNPSVALVTPRDQIGADGSVQRGGKVTGRDPGEAIITALAGVARATCKVTVTSGGSSTIEVESIVIRPAPVTLTVDGEQVLTAYVVPSDAKVNVQWSSSKSGIVALGSIGQFQSKIQGLAAGTTTVTASAGGKTATCEVTVEAGSSTAIPVQSITLNKTSLTLNVGQSEQLLTTILPANATYNDNDFEWTTTEPRKAYVNGGLVTAYGACVATITVTYRSNREVYASCTVTVQEGSSGTGDEVVDLGLTSGLKWRAWNVGASKPEDYGNHYAWGETTTKTSYTWSNYSFGNSQNGSFSKYDTGLGTDNKTVLESGDDAATVNVGSGWRTPTYSEWKELREQCTWKWTTRNGVNGMQVTGPNGKSIFLPAAGWRDSALRNQGSYGAYWTATLGGVQGMADAVDFISSGKDIAVIARCDGRSIRPVKN